MLAAGADPNPTYTENCNPLSIAMAVRHIPLMEILLEAHADPNGVAVMGMSILYGAVLMRYEAGVELLLRRGARPDLTPTSPSLLSMASRSPAIFRFLLNAGADPNRKDTYEGTPLMETARRDTELMRSLLDKGANPNIYDDRGWSALLNAVETQNVEAINMLIGHGADVNHRDRDGWSAYDEARVLGCPAVVKILENAGAKD
jgi:ankyrin repeat protein